MKNAVKTDQKPVISTNSGDRRFCVAPMMEWTDRHFRYFCRLLSKHSVLYTEMVTTGAIIHGDEERHLKYDPFEHPLALQLGGSDPKALAECTRRAEDWGYAEVNLNVGCPSDRVQNNMIGACLMAHPELVAECIDSMQQAVNIPVTVKHIIGIDDRDSYEELHGFVDTVAKTGCKTFIVHARKAILQGLSPKENRDIPPLIYPTVYRLKDDFPELEIIINGGIKSIADCKEHLSHVDGVMLGREVYQNPWILAQIDQELYQQPDSIPDSRHDVIEAFYDYIQRQLDQDVYLGYITRHILGLFHGQPGGRKFRRYLSENAHKPGADLDVLKAAV
ncbi:MAG: tRNA dihydrouridine(20/20a) synthase DusA, partial [Pseudomonadales bacterium]|nr:tRNA dihydrouridine(20/20a) synthase DusA [Pseudomonadales bacterium]